MKSFVYLASQSPRRRQILNEMGIRHRVVLSAYQETHRKILPQQLVVEHAVGKVRGAEIFARKGRVLGSDTLVYCRNRVLGKPKNFIQACQMLRLLSGKAHSVFTGVAILDLETGEIKSGFCETKVFVKKLSKENIEDYCRKVNVLDKAGSYAIQMEPKIVTKIKGSYSNVVGLPKALVRKLLSFKK